MWWFLPWRWSYYGRQYVEEFGGGAGAKRHNQMMVVYENMDATIESVEEAYQNGYDDGYLSGKADGYDNGYAEGYRRGLVDIIACEDKLT